MRNSGVTCREGLGKVMLSLYTSGTSLLCTSSDTDLSGIERVKNAYQRAALLMASTTVYDQY